MHPVAEGFLCEFFDVVYFCHGDQPEGAQARTDDYGLGIVIADYADALIPLKFFKIRLEFRPEVCIFKVVDRPGKTLRIMNRKPCPARAEVRKIIGSVKKVGYTIFVRNNAE